MRISLADWTLARNEKFRWNETDMTTILKTIVEPIYEFS